MRKAVKLHGDDGSDWYIIDPEQIRPKYEELSKILHTFDTLSVVGVDIKSRPVRYEEKKPLGLSALIETKTTEDQSELRTTIELHMYRYAFPAVEVRDRLYANTFVKEEIFEP